HRWIPRGHQSSANLNLEGRKTKLSGFKLAELWWPRGIQRCSDRIHKSRTHPRVCYLSNWKFFCKASELCKWLRHSHVTASTPSFGTGCVMY
ncbi:hypothetical protein DVH24_005845, partial [Malus domestica]